MGLWVGLSRLSERPQYAIYLAIFRCRSLAEESVERPLFDIDEGQQREGRSSFGPCFNGSCCSGALPLPLLIYVVEFDLNKVELRTVCCSAARKIKPPVGNKESGKGKTR